MLSPSASVAILGALLLVASCGDCGAHAYNVAASLKWVSTMGCRNDSITNCPGGRLCTDAEFYARALAAGGVIDLDPNDPSQVPYTNYEGFNLCLGEPFTDFLLAYGFQQTDPMFDTPAGALVFTEAWYPPGMPIFSLGNGDCDAHTPIVSNGPHCQMSCRYFVPKVVLLPPPPPATISLTRNSFDDHKL